MVVVIGDGDDAEHLSSLSPLHPPRPTSVMFFRYRMALDMNPVKRTIPGSGS